MARRVQRSYKYRWYPTNKQAAELTRTFGCVRLIYNKALEARTAAWHTEQRQLGYVRTSALLTEWKRTDELAFLNDVSSVPLQQALRHLQAAFAAFSNKSRWLSEVQGQEALAGVGGVHTQCVPLP
jgi:putative transposase